MTDVLTVDEINARYPNANVLIAQPEKDDQSLFVRGQVAGVGSNQNTAFSHIVGVPPGTHVAIHYTNRPTPNGTL
jgi:hypothetical protein